ncbi:hypothetical protein CPB86DRAFT_821022 [Serendipita vermifera]|nr:hypothetical protein CPB86DRAFT_821022 [Serendipita vermifera]
MAVFSHNLSLAPVLNLWLSLGPGQASPNYHHEHYSLERFDAIFVSNSTCTYAALSLDITAELSTRDDCVLTGIAHLILEFSLNGNTVSDINLLSRESMPGIWDADTALHLYAF